MSYLAQPYRDIEISILGEGGSPGIVIKEDSGFWDLSDLEQLEQINIVKAIIGEFDLVMRYQHLITVYSNKDLARNWDRTGLSSEDIALIARSKFIPESLREQLWNFLREEEDKKAKRGIKRSANKTLRQQIIEKDKSTCRYCGKHLEKKEIYIDHVVPYSLGGRTEPDNLVVSCFDCNSKKSGKLLSECKFSLQPGI